MIRHQVLVRFKPETTPEQKVAIFAELGNLQGRLSGILDYRHGPNVSPEEPVIHGFNDGFFFDFTDANARDAYLTAPAHKAAAAKLVAATARGREDIVVFDMELPGN